jgi:hypothetical protein
MVMVFAYGERIHLACWLTSTACRCVWLRLVLHFGLFGTQTSMPLQERKEEEISI